MITRGVGSALLLPHYLRIMPQTRATHDCAGALSTY
jgi:hypothetical protein